MSAPRKSVSNARASSQDAMSQLGSPTLFNSTIPNLAVASGNKRPRDTEDQLDSVDYSKSPAEDAVAEEDAVPTAAKDEKEVEEERREKTTAPGEPAAEELTFARLGAEAQGASDAAQHVEAHELMQEPIVGGSFSNGGAAGDLLEEGKEGALLTNEQVAAAVAKTQVWAMSEFPKHQGGGECTPENQAVHMVPAEMKALLTLVDVYGWQEANVTNQPTLSFVVALAWYFARTLAVRCDSPEFGPCSVANFNQQIEAVPRRMAYDGALGDSRNIIKYLKEYVDAQPPGTVQMTTKKTDDGSTRRLLVLGEYEYDARPLSSDVAHTGNLPSFLESLAVHQTDVFHVILQVVDLTAYHAKCCFEMAMSPKYAPKVEGERPVTELQRTLKIFLKPKVYMTTAVWNRHVKFVREFGTKATVNIDLGGQESSLQMAVRSNGVAMVKVLLSMGANVEGHDHDQKTKHTPLRHASLKGNADVVEILLTNGADVNGQDRFGRTALHFASLHGHLQVVRMLLQAQADPAVLDNRGSTALHLATRYAPAETRCDVMKELAEAAAALSARNEKKVE